MASYHVYQLLWIFFVYSFIGWCGEAAMAAVRRHKFVNRGFVSGPLCPVYGAGAAAVAVFLPELHDRLFFLFLGGMIVTTFVEYLTGRLLELIFHRKWWDYSDEKFNLDGYVCLKNSAIWGLCSVLMICFFDPLLCRLIDLIPRLAGDILLWISGALLVIDAVGSGVAVLGLKKKQSRITQITEELHKTSKLLENALTTRIQRRMVRAFPNIEGTEGARVKTKEERFARGCGFFKLASLFILGAFLGDIVETVFCLATTGRFMSRSSLVFGPFSIVWGLACALLTWILYRYRDKSDRYIFVFGTVLGGAYEYVCSVFTEMAFGTVFWDYSKIPFNLGGRINLLYCFFWGIAAVVWMKGVYPFLSRWIEKLPARAGKILCSVLLVLLAADMAVSALALARYSKRQAGEAEQTAVGQALDEFFPDEFIEKRYENLKLTD
ncbi:MAG TPA: putative ABC transporter permease [Candidatus Mediterraneibacter tabaqchaliae]|uniref:ABC transporter permease n=1 Tax=Candidatus Mediterraneibacter tabaqchaliae TaxID=2838689 RepID=A0A9D2U2I6_9FIRM|nr:putative ABC transporter permease [Candidatus Mediterraneibacter tabaqchaliae]